VQPLQREFARHFEGQAEPACRALEVVLGIAALQRDGGQRLLAGDLEHGTEQDRMPDRGAVVFCGEGVDFGRREITVGGGKVEIKLNGFMHVALLSHAQHRLPRTEI